MSTPSELNHKSPLVSILCHTYNHEAYIAQAIDSFLCQKTNFRFEICIHDDKSTDRTAQIIGDYKRKYPHLIKVITQSINQYSQGKVVSLLNFQQSTGEFLAFCEGDDYWTDPYKLQKQIDYLLNHVGCSLVAHAYLSKNQLSKLSFRHQYSKENKIVESKEILESFNPIFHLNSLVMKRVVVSSMPDFYKELGTIDYVIQFSALINGQIFYMKDFMSVYRTGLNKSWTSMNAMNFEKLNQSYMKKRVFLEHFNLQTSAKYSKIIQKHLAYIDFMIKIRSKTKMRFSELYDFIENMPIMKKVQLILEYLFPNLSIKIRNFILTYLR